MKNLKELIQTALKEDLGDSGDVTTLATVATDVQGSAKIIAKAEGIIAGGFVVEKVFAAVDPLLQVKTSVEDGARVKPGQKIVDISGAYYSILIGERTALNFFCRLSGIATLTAKFVALVAGTGVKILDTRKTTPGLRALEKYAVRMGGGQNHRSGLYDMVLIKENHIAAAGGIKEAITSCTDYLQRQKLNLKIEIETRNLSDVAQALNFNVDRIMLDNMSCKEIKEAVALINKRVEVEISGGVNLDNIQEYAQTGVDYISIGALTHSAKVLDLSLLIDST